MYLKLMISNWYLNHIRNNKSNFIYVFKYSISYKLFFIFLLFLFFLA